MKTDLLDQYALIGSQIKDLSTQKDNLQKEILDSMEVAGEEKVESGLGKFSITYLKKWDYPEYVTEAKDNYDLLKAKAESAGDASFTTAPSLRFTAIKL